MGNTNWKTYEEVAAYLLNMFAEHFGLARVEGKQIISGGIRSNTEYEIDAKGICQGNEAFVIIECRRRTTSRQNQEQIGGLAYRIINTGAQGGIVVSPLGFQSGAKKVAQAENIVHVELHEKSTPTEFAMRFLNKVFLGINERSVAKDHFEVELVSRVCKVCGEKFSVKVNERTCSACSL